MDRGKEDTAMNAPRRRTNRIITEAFIELLKENQLEKITVREICEYADINRTTFYRYYQDTFDLYDKITDNLFDELFTETVARHYENGLRDEDIKAEVIQALELIEKKKDLCTILFDTASSRFSNHLSEQFLDISMNKNREGSHESDKILRFRLYFLSGGIISIVIGWLKEGCKTEKSVISEIVSTQIAQAFIPAQCYNH